MQILVAHAKRYMLLADLFKRQNLAKETLICGIAKTLQTT